MNFKIFHTLPVFLLILAASAVAKDTVILNNGDVLTGTILKENPDHIYFRTSAFGAVSLQTRDVAEIRFETEEHGELVTHMEKPAAEPSILPPPPIHPVPQKFNPWSGQAGLSLAMRESTKYNNSGTTGTDDNETYRFYGNMGWKTHQNKMRWDWTYRYSRDEYEKQDDYLNLTQHYTRDFRENYYATAKTMYQRDYRRRVDHEYLQTAEMGIKWIFLPDLELSTSAGGGYHRYDLTENNSSDKPTDEVSVFLDQTLRWQLIKSLTLIQKYTHLGDLTNYHFVFTAGLENKLVKDIFLRMEYRLDRDTGMSDKDSGYSDKALLTSLLYKF